MCKCAELDDIVVLCHDCRSLRKVPLRYERSVLANGSAAVSLPGWIQGGPIPGMYGR